MCSDSSNISVRTAVMRRLGAWMQFYLKLGARARCGWPAPYILPVSDIFLDVRGCCRSVRLARRLTLLTKLFLASIRLRYASRSFGSKVYV